MSEPKVVISGVGVLAPTGIGTEAFWKSLLEGTSGISEVTLFDTSKFSRHRGGQIKDFDPAAFIPHEMCEFLGRASQLAIAATKLALRNARLPLKTLQGKKTGLIIGTTMAEANVIDTAVPPFIQDKWDDINVKFLLNSFAPSIPRNMGHFFKIKGSNALIPNACAAGNYAIGQAYDLIRKGEVEVAIAGGVEALSRIAFQGFQRLYAMAPDICAPFDKNRKGMVLGEGAGVLIIESLESALERNASVYAEVLGYGLSCDAHHMTIPHKEGVKKAMQKALLNSGMKPSGIDYINAHGTGTSANDKNESAAIRDVFGTGKNAPPVSSVKSMTGHTMGASSAIEAIACCLAMQYGVMPPTINYATPDPECDIDCVPNTARKKDLRTVLNNGFAFGGNNCCVVLSKSFL